MSAPSPAKIGICCCFVFAVAYALGLFFKPPEVAINQYLHDFYNLVIRVLIALIISVPLAPIAQLIKSAQYMRARSSEEGLDLIIAAQTLRSGEDE
ncbi:hypothetical protein FACS189490_10470 [Clostridia bacterium]|nr:hypothetical protein FACS189490_10470 [Clostridia bacterium]